MIHHFDLGSFFGGFIVGFLTMIYAALAIWAFTHRDEPMSDEPTSDAGALDEAHRQVFGDPDDA